MSSEPVVAEDKIRTLVGQPGNDIPLFKVLVDNHYQNIVKSDADEYIRLYENFREPNNSGIEAVTLTLTGISILKATKFINSKNHKNAFISGLSFLIFGSAFYLNKLRKNTFISKNNNNL